MSVVVSAMKLTKVFNRRVIFRDISFSIADSQVLVITGRNGSGKSTLVKLLSQVLTPSGGESTITVDDTVLPAEESHRAIGLVSPYLQMYEEFSARENLAMAMALRGRRVEAGRIVGLLEKVGLRSRADDPVRAFSSGMKQRVKYAFALVHAPRVLILDEPMANLDADGIALARCIMEEQMGNGVLIVATNDLSDVPRHDLKVDLNAGA